MSTQQDRFTGERTASIPVCPWAFGYRQPKKRYLRRIRQLEETEGQNQFRPWDCVSEEIQEPAISSRGLTVNQLDGLSERNTVPFLSLETKLAAPRGEPRTITETERL